MRQILAELDHRDDGTFTVARLTDENTNDITYLVEPGQRFAATAGLEALLAAELGSPVTVEED